MKLHVFRIVPGQDLHEEILARVRALELKAAVVTTCVGSLREASLRFAGKKELTRLPGPFEILALSGTVSDAGSHLHIAIADGEGRTFGGHLPKSGNPIHTTAEIALAEVLGIEFRREPDATTGYRELVVAPVKN